MDELFLWLGYFGQVLVMLGIAFTAFGVYSILSLDGFYARIVVTSKVEVMGFVTFVIGTMFMVGLSPMVFKLLLIILFEMLTVSAASHAIVRSAWVSGYRIKTITQEDKNG